MKIGELAKITGTPVETIRYYEREGLLAAPARTMGNFRIYTGAYVERLSFIRRCRLLDMTHEEIRALLRFKDDPRQDCADVNSLLDAHIAHVSARIHELRQLEEQLKRLRECCSEPSEAARCGILRELSQPLAEDRTRGNNHVTGSHPGKLAQ
ncbi:Cd(II)/Pb(II)-responsive transcriptional regulator [Azotobacter vinelandii]|uniref:Cd(II)/Pb(II)-responsive transcriptional regulator n=1 Tax=Azotobacter vinelandii TaxID=354 RepID=UPI0007749D1D|nr:Cd(II)/Pb(II)-responsive transcriptional regulator [Azotobacter vinelandii]